MCSEPITSAQHDVNVEARVDLEKFRPLLGNWLLALIQKATDRASSDFVEVQ